MVRDSNSGHQLLLPPANWRPHVCGSDHAQLLVTPLLATTQVRETPLMPFEKRSVVLPHLSGLFEKGGGVFLKARAFFSGATQTIEELDLSFNRLNGTVPAQLGNLNRLRSARTTNGRVHAVSSPMAVSSCVHAVPTTNGPDSCAYAVPTLCGGGGGGG